MALSTSDSNGIPDAIVLAAMKEPYLRTRVKRHDSRRVPLMRGPICVGFVTPHEMKMGWRAGPIYVDPLHRGQGHVTEFYRGHSDRTWLAFIWLENKSAIRLHKQAGFQPLWVTKGGQWWKKPSV